MWYFNIEFSHIYFPWRSLAVNYLYTNQIAPVTAWCIQWLKWIMLWCWQRLVDWIITNRSKPNVSDYLTKRQFYDMLRVPKYFMRIYDNTYNSKVSCRKGPIRHAYAWQIGPFWQDTLELCLHWECMNPIPKLTSYIVRIHEIQKYHKTSGGVN